MTRVTEKYPNLDDREGSLLYNALAPAALELAMAYTVLDLVRNQSFVDTATREFILIGCEQMGIDTSQFYATAGTFKAEFDVQVPIGSRWNCELFNYSVTEYIGEKTIDSSYGPIGATTTKLFEYKLKCENVGSDANNQTGLLTPITSVPSNLTYAKLTGCLIEGENEKTDDEIKEIYWEYVKNTVSDGNVAQYKRWCAQYPGIGNYKIVPLWNGANTVKVSILSSSNRKASDGLITEFQKYLDPVTIQTYNDSVIGSSVTLADKPQSIDSVLVNNIPMSTDMWSYEPSKGILTIADQPIAQNAKVYVRYNGGMGNGVAPIGAFVTVDTATEKKINVKATVSLKSGYTDTSGIATALEEFFSDISYQTSKVSYMSVGAKILSVEGVDFITNLKLNNGTTDISLSDFQIPVLGTTNWTVAS